ncbi:MlaA family lipoprotein [Avibacterium paragallinarum]|uniref:VacJ family lipoprotein n=1 Tax=Avibacterium paragallinarum TaxID=728 RepID=A0AAE5TKB2_AVIPA|nr:VacJ family lipoprotein [Avibacterium paragallinarum]MEE3608423.1 VacJ family lipoprotein [Avibacterium paragallinarum]MEE3620512.1 VacJ family lipoprotein [Avibacterium paragallinarum]MEE3667861.1 VacJ family lipoprotein [Avibacterium paragallinarum]MEE3680116.1 VacJ family lipoprotein [Avibacterium paragallinarum]MEE4385215.1 VacJ family lipoprotein [Avibacterium paragallinarum]
MKRSYLLASLVLGSSILAGCATIDPKTGERNDPLEGFNRMMWDFNYNVADPYLLKPVAKGWKEYVPQPIKTGITNVANNLDEPASFVNRLLQGDFKKAMVHFNRFWINSVFGLGGLIDWASASPPLRLEESRRFGDTLGSYGVGTGSYVMLPLYGPATPRQDLGNLVDTTYPMLSLLGPWGVLKWGIQGVNARAKMLDKEALLEQSQDPYVTFREAYFQNLEYRVNDGKVQTVSETLSQDELKEID